MKRFVMLVHAPIACVVAAVACRRPGVARQTGAHHRALSGRWNLRHPRSHAGARCRRRTGGAGAERRGFPSTAQNGRALPADVDFRVDRHCVALRRGGRPRASVTVPAATSAKRWRSVPTFDWPQPIDHRAIVS
jgi:hypothetical protein